MPDRAFIPFNFSAVLPFDALASALNQLPTLHPNEPFDAPFDDASLHAGGSSRGDATPVTIGRDTPATPSVEEQVDMRRLMISTVQDEEWRRSVAQHVSIPDPPLPRQTLYPPWLLPFCNQLSSNIQQSFKRTSSLQSPMKRPPTKRPRPRPLPNVVPSLSPTGFDTQMHSPADSSSEGPLRPPPSSTRGRISHAQERRRVEDAKLADRQDFDTFVDGLRRFVNGGTDLSQSSCPTDTDSFLAATASLPLLCDIRQSILLFSARGAIGSTPVDLLRSVLAILRSRLRECSRQCGLADSRRDASVSSDDASIGAVAASTVLTLLCAPKAPHGLLVEELLEDIVDAFRLLATVVVFPLFDPLYKAAKTAPNESKKRRNITSIATGHRSADTLAGTSDDPDVCTDTKRSNPRRELRKMDTVLLEHFRSLLDSLSSLFQQEVFLPDALVSQCATVCVQFLTVTGVTRLQSYAIKTACAIFSHYPSHRISMIDDVREAVSVVPSTRKHLRSYQLVESQSVVRGPSALLCILLCASSNRVESDQHHEQETEASDYLNSLLSRHQQAVKLAVRVIDPLFARACADRDSEFRTAFQSFFEDMLTLYGRPEWPSAELMLQTLSVAIITKLRGGCEKSVYARALAIDMLASLSSNMVRVYGSEILEGKDLHPLSAAESTTLEDERKKVLFFLNPQMSSSVASANAFLEALFYSDDHNSIALNGKLTIEKDAMINGNHSDTADKRTSVEVADKMTSSMRKRAIERRASLSHGSNDAVTRADAISALQFVGARRSFAGGFKKIMEAILDGMHDQAPTIRSKSIKALSSIDEACNGLLRRMPEVLPFIEDSCRDVSTLTRDAALDLLSRSLLEDVSVNINSRHVANVAQDAHLLKSAFEIVMRRLCDTATSVRKRAIAIARLVLADALARCKDMQKKTTEGMEPMDGRDVGRSGLEYEERIVRICTNLVPRLDDPENSVREAAERVLRYALFGFDVSSPTTWKGSEDCDDAPQLSRRLTGVFIKLQAKIHNSFLSRVVHKALLIRDRALLTSMVSSCVEHLHEYEEQISDMVGGRDLKLLTPREVKLVKALSIQRVGCSSVVCAFGSLDASLVEPHCRSLSPAVKGVVDGSVSEADLATVQRVLNVLEIGLGRGNTNDGALVDEVISDVEVIVCKSPTGILEEASVRCLCALASKSAAKENEDVVLRCATVFKEFLDDNMDSLRECCTKPSGKRLSSEERNGRCALVRLGLLSRYGTFGAEFTREVYITLSVVCETVGSHDGRGQLAKASARALSHFFIRHRTFLTEGTKIFVDLMNKWETEPRIDSTNMARCEAQLKGEGDGIKATVSMGIRLSILQGFHDLLRDEEDRNVTSDGAAELLEKHDSRRPGMDGQELAKMNKCDELHMTHGGKQREQPILAAEEDAEAGYLALSAQAMLACVKASAQSSWTPIRRTVSNILGLLVRQGLLLPATVVPCLFSLLLDQDVLCRELSMRVVTFLGDRHSSMLTSAVIPALRSCFKQAYHVLSGAGQSVGMTGESKGAPPADAVLNMEVMRKIALDGRTGHSLLSGALMCLRREQRRGVLEYVMKEFDPRVVVCTVNADERLRDGASALDLENDDDVGDMTNGERIDVTELDGASQERCPLGTLCFLGMTLACLDYTDGAGVGGSLAQGGGTAAAEGKLKVAQEDVNKLVGQATRIISNSGQAVLRVAKQVCKLACNGCDEAREKKKRLAGLASRICLLLKLKHHMKVERWIPLSDGLDEESANCRMPEFCLPNVNMIQLVGWGSDAGVNLVSDEIAEEQLQELFQLMRDDAIDEADVTPVGRRGKQVPGRSNRGRGRSSRSSRRKSGGAMGTELKRDAMVESAAAGASKRTTPRWSARRSSSAKRKSYAEAVEGEDGGEADSDGSDIDYVADGGS